MSRAISVEFASRASSVTPLRDKWTVLTVVDDRRSHSFSLFLSQYIYIYIVLQVTVLNIVVLYIYVHIDRMHLTNFSFRRQ